MVLLTARPRLTQFQLVRFIVSKQRILRKEKNPCKDYQGIYHYYFLLLKPVFPDVVKLNMKYKKPRKLDSGGYCCTQKTYTKPHMTKKQDFWLPSQRLENTTYNTY